MRNRPRPAASRRLAAAAALLILACQPPPERAAPLPVQHHPYTPAAPERALHFPADHGPHREAAIEWWYFTGHILTPPASAPADPAGPPRPAPSAAAVPGAASPPAAPAAMAPTGRTASPAGAGAVPVPSAAGLEQAGFEVTVFRISPPAGPLAAAPAAGRPAQASFLSLHVAVTDLAGRTFRHKTLGLRERLGVAWVAGSPERPLDLRLPGATITLAADGSFRVEADLTDEQGAPLQVHATLGSDKPVTLHGAGGYSRKGSCASCASHYSSFPRLRGPASVSSAGGERRGTAVAWFDHEFSSGALGGGLRGWDWLALQLDDGWELMAAQTRSASGEPAGRAATLIAPGGEVTALAEGELTLTPSGAWLSPHSGATYPARWRVQVRSRVHPLDATLVPRLADQELAGPETALATYWEGTCEVRIADQPAGLSYLEMTGYDPRHLPRL
jgi:predicted secreted hydrolase